MPPRSTKLETPDRGTLLLRVYDNWFYAGATVAAFLAATVPLLWASWTGALLMVFVQLPVYMVHQVEEYYKDRFRTALNNEVAGGREALTRQAALVINLGGVWLVDLVALYLAHFVRPGLGLIAVYLALVNAAVHLLSGAVRRAYNPGLLTAAFLLLPAGVCGSWLLDRAPGVTAADDAWGLGVALGVHAAIAVHIFRRVRLLKGSFGTRPSV